MAQRHLFPVTLLPLGVVAFLVTLVVMILGSQAGLSRLLKTHVASGETELAGMFRSFDAQQRTLVLEKYGWPPRRFHTIVVPSSAHVTGINCTAMPPEDFQLGDAVGVAGVSTGPGSLQAHVVQNYSRRGRPGVTQGESGGPGEGRSWRILEAGTVLRTGRREESRLAVTDQGGEDVLEARIDLTRFNHRPPNTVYASISGVLHEDAERFFRVQLIGKDKAVLPAEVSIGQVRYRDACMLQVFFPYPSFWKNFQANDLLSEDDKAQYNLVLTDPAQNRVTIEYHLAGYPRPWPVEWTISPERVRYPNDRYVQYTWKHALDYPPQYISQFDLTREQSPPTGVITGVQGAPSRDFQVQLIGANDAVLSSGVLSWSDIYDGYYYLGFENAFGATSWDEFWTNASAREVLDEQTARVQYQLRVTDDDNRTVTASLIFTIPRPNSS